MADEEEIVSVCIDGGPLSAKLGEYVVGISLTDHPDVVRVDGKPERPESSGLAFEWAKLDGLPIEVRYSRYETAVQFRLYKTDSPE